MKIPIDLLQKKVLNILKSGGLSSQESLIIFNHLLHSELSGHASHGFRRIKKIIHDLRSNKIEEIKKIKNIFPFAINLNGGNKTGIIVAQKATQLSINIAKKKGVALVGGFNNTGSIGSLAYFTKQIASQDLIAIMMVASEYAMAPWGGIDPILGTNPISFAFPNDEQPIVIDFASSVWSYGDLKIAMQKGLKIPTGIVISEEGNESTDPNDADNGSQLPIAQHKGYCLAFAIEMLAGLFVNAKVGNKSIIGKDGFLIIAFKKDLFVEGDYFKNGIHAITNEIKQSRIRPAFENVYIPGEKSFNKYNQNKDKKEIILDDAVYEEIISL